MIQACTLFLSGMGRFGLGLLLTLALTDLRTLFLRLGLRFLPRSVSLQGLGSFALTLFAIRRILTLSLFPLSSKSFEEVVRLSILCIFTGIRLRGFVTFPF